MPEGKHFVSKLVYFLFLGRVNVPKKMGARNAPRSKPTSSVVKTTFKVWTNHFIWLFFKTNFKTKSQALELALPRNSECLRMSTFFHRITDTVLSLFRKIFSERNSDPNLKGNPNLCATAYFYGPEKANN
jgi:hypothetical protein